MRVRTDPMHWSSRYVGTPYEEAHCWELVRRVYREQYAIELPSYDGELVSDEERNLIRFLASAAGTSKISSAIERHAIGPTWRDLDPGEEREGDVALLWYTRPGYVTHCGVVLEGGLMLNARLKGQSVVESYVGHSAWARRLVRIVRHRERA